MKQNNYRFIAPSPISFGFAGAVICRDSIPVVMAKRNARTVTRHSDILEEIASLTNSSVRIEAQLWFTKVPETETVYPEIKYNFWVNPRANKFGWHEVGIFGDCRAEWKEKEWLTSLEADMLKAVEAFCERNGLNCSRPVLTM